MIVVLGGGFGLYGHVAALISENKNVATLARYRATAERRPELEPLLDGVIWIEDEGEALACATTIVLARRPLDNEAIAVRAAFQVGETCW